MTSIPPVSVFDLVQDKRKRSGLSLSAGAFNLLNALRRKREIVDGGTGADNAADARSNLGLGTSDDVEFNDVSVNGHLSVSGSFTYANTAPRIRFEETDASSDEGLWDFVATNGAFALQVFDDAVSSGENVWLLSRSGASITRQRFYIGNTVHLDLIDGELDARALDRIVVPNRLECIAFSIADDAVVTIDYLESVFGGRLSVITNSNTFGCMDFRVRMATSPGCTVLNSAFSSYWTAYAGTVLTGTTGTDGTVNVSTQSDGSVIIENRSGFLLSVKTVLLG